MQRWRLVVSRDALDAGQGQREQLAAWEEALARSDLPLAGLDAPRGRPRVVPAAPLSASVPGERELFDVFLVDRLPRWQVRAALEASMPPGHRLIDLHDVWLGEGALPGLVTASVYRARVAPVGLDDRRLAAAARDLMDAPALPRQRPKGDRTVTYDLRPFLDGIEVVPAGAQGGEGGDRGRRSPHEASPVGGPAGAGDRESLVVRLVLRHDSERGVGRPDEALRALEERAGGSLELLELVRERLVLAAPPPPRAWEPPGRWRGPRAGPGGRRPAR